MIIVKERIKKVIKKHKRPAILSAVAMVAAVASIAHWNSSRLAAKAAQLAPQTALPDLRWEQMTAELQNAVNNYPGRVAVFLKDLKTSREWSHEPDKLFPSASLIKIPIMLTVFNKIKEGELRLDSALRLKAQDRKSGSGRLKWQRAGTFFTVNELLYYMITESDNTAAQMLMSYLGWDYLKHQFSAMDLIYTNINKDGFNLTSQPIRKENYTTAREMTHLLKRLHRGALMNDESSQAMIELLKNQRHRSRLAETLPAGWQIAHKTGLLRRACHDAGIIYSPEGDYVLVVLTWKGKSYKQAKRYIAQMGRITYKYFGGESDVAASNRNHYPGI